MWHMVEWFSVQAELPKSCIAPPIWKKHDEKIFVCLCEWMYVWVQSKNVIFKKKQSWFKALFHRDDSFSVPFHQTCLPTVTGSKKQIHAAFKSSFKGFPFAWSIWSMFQQSIFKISFVHLDLCHDNRYCC